ncbi:MAG: hypothetical protein M3295_00945, partial [Chloroflexota bacterium]|nr:hypothetical protein [Chloroflexota bacterium]
CQAVAFDQGAASWAIVLPGAGYSAQAPLLWYARRAVLEAGRSVLAITDVFDRQSDEDPIQWVEERVKGALEYVRATDAHPLLIAKSLTSLASRLAAAEGLPAVWLTPLIADEGTSVAAQVLAGLRSGDKPRLLIGGTDDPTWDGRTASSLPHTAILELPGADHSLEAANDVARSLEYLKRATDAMSRFAASLG